MSQVPPRTWGFSLLLSLVLWALLIWIFISF